MTNIFVAIHVLHGSANCLRGESMLKLPERGGERGRRSGAKKRNREKIEDIDIHKER